jgi:hypothetical protein
VYETALRIYPAQDMKWLYASIGDTYMWKWNDEVKGQTVITAENSGANIVICQGVP